MKVILTLVALFLLAQTAYSKELSLEEFKKLIKTKQDNVELVSELKILPFHKKVLVKFKYMYEDRDDVKFELKFDMKSVQGIYLISRSKFDGNDDYVYHIRAFDKDKNMHINHVLFPTGKFYKAYGTIGKDIRTVHWKSQTEDVKSTGIEKISKDKSETIETHKNIITNQIYQSVISSEILQK